MTGSQKSCITHFFLPDEQEIKNKYNDSVYHPDQLLSTLVQPQYTLIHLVLPISCYFSDIPTELASVCSASPTPTSSDNRLT
jgi:hypothetical protein